MRDALLQPPQHRRHARVAARRYTRSIIMSFVTQRRCCFMRAMMMRAARYVTIERIS